MPRKTLCAAYRELKIPGFVLAVDFFRLAVYDSNMNTAPLCSMLMPGAVMGVTAFWRWRGQAV
jgi:hypothetical protein